MPVESTNLKRDASNTEYNFCNSVNLTGVNLFSFYVNMEELTSAKAAPYLIALSKDFSIDPFINGAYSLSNLSSSWSDKRKASAYADIY